MNEIYALMDQGRQDDENDLMQWKTPFEDAELAKNNARDLLDAKEKTLHDKQNRVDELQEEFDAMANDDPAYEDK